MPERLHIVWFKRDLRVEDHRPLAAAAEAGPVLPLLVAEPGWWGQETMAGRHWDFVAECLAELRAALAALGQPLVIRVGEPEAVFEAVRRAHGLAGLWSHEETGDLHSFARDRRVAAWARARGVPWREFRQSGVIRRIGSRDGWARRWDAFMAEPAAKPPALAPLAGVEPGPIPNAAALGLAPDLCPGRQAGGRAAALERLASFLAKRGETYRRAMSAPVPAAEACSRLSPHLAWGTLSMREAAQALAARRAERPGGHWPGALASFSGRLHWRDHFMQKLEDEPEIERRALHPAYRADEAAGEGFEAWAKGETGLPFADACMRSLRETGWLNFRMRAMLVSLAAHHLGLGWRRPGAHLARLFTDYEPGIHWPQVQMQAGVTGVNTIRIYNPVKQGKDQDAAGAFIRRWLPELGPVPGPLLHEPWLWDGARALAYPPPLIDHEAAARRAREALWRRREAGGFGAPAGAIQAKHGSRRAGIPHRGGRRKPAEGQLSLPLPE